MKALFPALMAMGLSSMAHAQPHSTSMAECAALYQNAAQWVKSGSVAKVMYANNQWYDAAVAQAKAEGIRDAETAMRVLMDARTDEWEARGAMFFASQEFRDWSSYCKSFARNQGIDFE